MKKKDKIIKQLKEELESDPWGLGAKDTIIYFNNLFIKETGREILVGDLYGWPEDFMEVLKSL